MNNSIRKMEMDIIKLTKEKKDLEHKFEMANDYLKRIKSLIDTYDQIVWFKKEDSCENTK